MPYQVKIQPVDTNEPVTKPVPNNNNNKSRFKRLFGKPSSVHHEPNSVCLSNMVRNFIEDNSNTDNKPGKNRCNCFNGNFSDSSDDDHDSYKSNSIDACNALKSLVSCTCVTERNLLADTARIVEKNKICKRKDEFCRKVVVDGLRVLGYNASICKSKWEKCSSFPAGEYEYVDVVIEGERLIIDIDFRSEFEIARSTKQYKVILQTLPNIFVGKSDRLEKIVHIVSESAKQSLKKKGMPFPPWRKAEYVKAKWISPFTRVGLNVIPDLNSPSNVCREKGSCDDGVKSETPPLMKKWELPEIKPKSLNKGVKIVTGGLASVIED